jgi:ligand-binding SRPBCC domain-containing protein
VNYTGKRQRVPAIQQRLHLPPGNYVLTFLVRTDALRSVGGVHWVVRCQGESLIGRSSPFTAATEWHTKEASFKVPADCRWQTLAMEAVTADEARAGFTGTVGVDKIELRRVGR